MIFERPHFDFSWDELYSEWVNTCEKEEWDLAAPRVLEYDIDSKNGDLDISSEYDWVPVSSSLSQIGPKRTTYKGYTFYTSRAPSASKVTVSMLMDHCDDIETVACILIMACALQLKVDFPPYWRGMHNYSFLSDLYFFCQDRLDDQVRLFWSANSKRIFPNKFYSKMLLETTDWLTVPQVVRFAVQNAFYYFNEWIVVRYTIDGLSVNEYREKTDRELIDRLDDMYSNALLTKDCEKCFNGKVDTTQLEREDSPNKVSQKARLLIPDSKTQKLREGSIQHKTGDMVERNPLARKLCLEHYGATCAVCGLNFGAVYGNEFAGIIDVHHIVPLGEQKGDHYVDPITDMIPLCPNCHRMIHKKEGGTYLPEELRELIRESKKINGDVFEDPLVME